MKIIIPHVEHYLASGCGRCSYYNTPQCKVNTWRAELTALRNILLQTQLKEEIKWSMPCYTFNGKNVVMISAFREYCALSFFKGVLLKDPHGLLSKPGENSRIARVMRFTSLSDIKQKKSIIEAYIREAIELEKSGARIQATKNLPAIPDEFEQKMDENPKLKKAFEALTPGRQRGYILYFTQAKQTKTRLSRIKKCIPWILIGKGLQD
ncbi:MAG: YdeI/OmpD-associated family protein [Cyclobacteriaceae bacterium]|nr:YdeI/OmpD-associated family protein [Cyclobacteriaceae bacterium]MDW8331708.1 YdeI/OmpD-associated family protein [Cyclobacteriaceae bacterium]